MNYIARTFDTEGQVQRLAQWILLQVVPILVAVLCMYCTCKPAATIPERCGILGAEVALFFFLRHMSEKNLNMCLQPCAGWTGRMGKLCCGLAGA